MGLFLVFFFRNGYNTIQYKNEYYYSGINPVEFRGHRVATVKNGKVLDALKC